ncbi:MAG TPA: ChaN family lipoprotein, partial [Planctomycetota bacterium]|nr:ChaN family lipoprotein [Planctomycetota bacterium]
SHRAMLGGGPGAGQAGGAAETGAAPSPEEDAASAERLTSTQSLWDNTMGESCARALERHPGHLVLHVNGGFHSQYWDGTVRQLRLRRPGTRIATVAIEPVASPQSAELGGAPAADYVVFAERRADDPQDGEGSLWVQRELKYALHLPPSAAPGAGGASVPLLIWLSDDGLTTEESLRLWQQRLGDEAAIAVLEASYLETQEDLAPGGRWFGAESFDEDIGVAATAVERLWSYLVDHTPVDPARVCLAGEGAGATVVAAAALYADRLAARALAIAPRQHSRLRDLPLPLPELRGDDPPPATSLRVVVGAAPGASAADWWRDELVEYARVGFPAELVPATADPWQAQRQVVDEVRAALGLAPLIGEPDAGEADARPDHQSHHYLLVEPDSPRALLWGRLSAERLVPLGTPGKGLIAVDTPPSGDLGSAIAFEIGAEGWAEGERLPACPGPFGGTTVVVLPAGTPAEQVAAWKALVEDDPLTKRNRFTRLRVATSGGDPADELPAVLARLESENRRNVLIVPAVFHAGGEAMRALERSVRAFEERMTLHWLPGLGGR